MNIENVKIGDKFTTVTKLYKALGLEAVKGKAKQLQDKEIARYLTYEKTGKLSRGKVTNEIVITEIFGEPKEKIDGRANNGGARYNYYAEYIDKLLLDVLTYNDSLSVTLKTLFTGDIEEFIPLFNKDGLEKLFDASDEYIKKTFGKVNPYWLGQYMYLLRDTYTNMFKSACNRLQKQGLIKWHKDYMVVRQYQQEKEPLYEMEQIAQVALIEQEVRESMGVKNPYANNEVYENWHDECLGRVQEEIDGDIFNYWSCYTINVIADEEEQEKWQLDKKVKEELAHKLGRVVLWRLHEKLQKHKEKKELAFGDDKIYYPYIGKNIVQMVLKAEKMIFNIDTNEDFHEEDETIYIWTTSNEIEKKKDDEQEREKEKKMLPF